MHGCACVSCEWPFDGFQASCCATPRGGVSTCDEPKLSGSKGRKLRAMFDYPSLGPREKPERHLEPFPPVCYGICR